MEKESLIHNKTVYIAVPKRLFDDEILARAIAYIHSLKPLSIDDPRGMFETNEDWLRHFPKYLESYNCVIVVTDNGLIGKGTTEEIKYFDRKQLPCYQYIEKDDYRMIFPIARLEVLDWNNWTDYARIS